MLLVLSDIPPFPLWSTKQILENWWLNDTLQDILGKLDRKSQKNWEKYQTGSQQSLQPLSWKKNPVYLEKLLKKWFKKIRNKTLLLVFS